MQKALAEILKIQELDLQMIRLMKLKQDRIKELENVLEIASDLKQKVQEKKDEIKELNKKIRTIEGELDSLSVRFKSIEDKQAVVKKVEEFNALSHELSLCEKEKKEKESALSDLFDKQGALEDFLKSLEETLKTTEENSKVLTSEIREAVARINQEGQQLMTERETLVDHSRSELFANYDRLIRKKKNQVVVPIENRCCSGCHMMVTAQDENLVRKEEQIVQCEHCSRILYWPIEVPSDGEKSRTSVRQRRRKSV